MGKASKRFLHSNRLLDVLWRNALPSVFGLDVIQSLVIQFHQWPQERSSHLQMSRLCGRSSVRTTLMNCRHLPLCHPFHSCVFSRRPLKPTLLLGSHGRAVRLKLMSRPFLGASQTQEWSSALAVLAGRRWVSAIWTQRQLSITKLLWRLLWPSSRICSLLPWLCWARHTWLCSSDSMPSFWNWLWRNLEISTCVPHRCLKFWMQTGPRGQRSSSSSTTQNGHWTTSWMKWLSVVRCFTPHWLLDPSHYLHLDRTLQKEDRSFQSRSPRNQSQNRPSRTQSSRQHNHPNRASGTTRGCENFLMAKVFAWGSTWTSASQVALAGSLTNAPSRSRTGSLVEACTLQPSTRLHHTDVQPLVDNSEPSQALQGLANFEEHPPQVVEVSRSPPKRHPIAIQLRQWRQPNFSW